MTAVTQAGKVRVAVVGTGEFGRNHARVYREIHNAELVGVYDKDSARAQAAASEFRTHAFASLDELAGRADAASVAVPTAEHATIGCRLMEMGLDVIVEKPMAKSLAEADALLAAAKRHQRVLPRPPAQERSGGGRFGDRAFGGPQGDAGEPLSS